MLSHTTIDLSLIIYLTILIMYLLLLTNLNFIIYFFLYIIFLLNLSNEFLAKYLLKD